MKYRYKKTNATFGFDEKIGSSRFSPNSRWSLFVIVTTGRKSDRNRIRVFLPDLFYVKFQCFGYFRNSFMD